MGRIEPPRLYQQLAAELRLRLEAGHYSIGDKLPAERLLAEEKNVSRTVVREAMIMLEVEGYIAVRKGSGIHVVSLQQKNRTVPPEQLEFAQFGPFELLQARQLIESNVAEFAATQITREDIEQLMDIQSHARREDRFRDSEWDMKFHVLIAHATRNSALATIVEKLWLHRLSNPYWLKLHEHIDERSMMSWCDDHDAILKSLIRKDPAASKLAMWQHLENTRQMLFNATSEDFDFNVDRYMFSENPVISLNKAPVTE
ncbi:transcriptional regulator [[Pantoea] beijingensis]|uniref:Transcriptional regulator n=1 Tax=[Pantoea] beijingensis TaxID=1324864 RepID=A0A443IAB6_9GAMM|nr:MULTISPECIES: transcriptional regulator ExuR [Erwiniaceae]RWR01034.1 transcriptional regulator [[Pantoea] beijingensis]